MEPTRLLNSLQWACSFQSIVMEQTWMSMQAHTGEGICRGQTEAVRPSQAEDQQHLPTPGAPGLHGRHREPPIYTLDLERQNVGRHVWPQPRGRSHHHSIRLWVTSGKTSAFAFALQHCQISTPKKHVLSLQIEKSMRTIFIPEKTKPGRSQASCANPKTPEAPKVTDENKGHENKQPVTSTAEQVRDAGRTADPGPTSHPNPTCWLRSEEGKGWLQSEPLSLRAARFDIRWGR